MTCGGGEAGLWHAGIRVRLRHGGTRISIHPSGQSERSVTVVTRRGPRRCETHAYTSDGIFVSLMKHQQKIIHRHISYGHAAVYCTSQYYKNGQKTLNIFNQYHAKI